MLSNKYNLKVLQSEQLTPREACTNLARYDLKDLKLHFFRYRPIKLH